MRSVWMLVTLAGCAAKDVADLDIPCMSDDECPTGEWCNAPFHVCQGKVGPPNLVFDNVPPSGRLAVTAPVHQVTFIKVAAHNAGDAQLELHVSVDGAACLDASAGRADAGILDPGKAIDLDLDVFPSVGCASPSAFTVTVDASGRKFAMGVDVTITP